MVQSQPVNSGTTSAMQQTNATSVITHAPPAHEISRLGQYSINGLLGISQMDPNGNILKHQSKLPSNPTALGSAKVF